MPAAPLLLQCEISSHPAGSGGSGGSGGSEDGDTGDGGRGGRAEEGVSDAFGPASSGIVTRGKPDEDAPSPTAGRVELTDGGGGGGGGDDPSPVLEKLTTVADETHRAIGGTQDAGRLPSYTSSQGIAQSAALHPPDSSAGTVAARS